MRFFQDTNPKKLENRPISFFAGSGDPISNLKEKRRKRGTGEHYTYSPPFHHFSIFSLSPWDFLKFPVLPRQAQRGHAWPSPATQNLLNFFQTRHPSFFYYPDCFEVELFGSLKPRYVFSKHNYSLPVFFNCRLPKHYLLAIS